MPPARRPSPRPPASDPAPNAPDIRTYRAVNRRRVGRRVNGLALIIGLPLIAVIALVTITGVLVIRRKVADLPADTPATTILAESTPDAGTTVNPQITATALIVTRVPSATADADSCGETQGQVLDKTFNSPIAGQPVPYRIYLPPCYASANRRYPYLILLHGAGDDQTEWTESIGVNQTLDQGIAVGKLPPMIVVMPYGGELEYENQFTEGASFESFVISDLIPEIEQHYCTLSAQADRALGGISRGGFWALEIGFRHPELFDALGGHSAYFDPDNAPAAYNPLDLAQSIAFPADKSLRLWLDVAADDPDTRAGLDALAQTLSTRGIDPGYTVYPTGGHVAAYWQAHLTSYLTFYGTGWPLDLSALPPCQ